MNTIMNIQKGIFGSAIVALFVVSATAAFSMPLSAVAYSSSYTPSYSTTYTPSSSSNSSGSGDYSGGCCSKGYSSSYTPSYSTTYTPSYSSTYTPSYSSTYTPSYSSTYTPSYTSTYTTPTYTTPTYTTPTYTTPTYTTPGCTGNCGGTTVIPTPTCTISVNKTSMTAGESVTVTWSSTNAQYGNIANLGNNLPASGSHALVLGNTTTFTGTFYGLNGKTATCSKTVTVNPVVVPAPTCTISGPNTATSGQTITLNWSSTNAQYGNIANLGTNLPASGSHSFVIGNTTTFSGTFFGTNGQQVTCSKTVTVSQPTPAPTCNMYGNPTSITAGQSSTLSWNSSNVSSVSISNIGSGLSANGSQVVSPAQTTTYTGTFIGNNGQQVTCSQTIVVTAVQYCPAGYTGTYPNCVPPTPQCPAGYTGSYPNCVPPPPVYGNPSCSITINNYNSNNNYYFQPNQAVTISWSSANASWGTINQGLGNVNLSGTRTVYPHQTTTYTGTFYGQNGQSVTCSATVYINNYVPPVNPGTPFITLSAVPYTGLELGPVGTVLYWAFIAFWCALAAYLIVVKRVQNQVYDSLMGIFFGKASSHAQVAHAGHAHVSYTTPVVRVEDKTDDFILSQINRVR